MEGNNNFNQLKLNVIAGIAFIVNSIIAVISGFANAVRFASDISPIVLISSIVGSLVSLIIAVALNKNIKNPSTSKTKTLLILLVFVNIPLFLLTAVNVLPQYLKHKEKVNKIWFVPALMAMIGTVINWINLGGLSILGIITALIGVAALLCFGKWITTNPYNVEPSDAVNSVKKSDQRSNTIVVIIVIVIIVIFSAIFSGGSSSKKSSGSSGNKSGGFIGSDGEYHQYVPEFGDDVNNWMENNW